MRLIQLKTCSCGRVHALIACYKFIDDPHLGGYYWECVCGSTMFARPDQVVEL